MTLFIVKWSSLTFEHKKEPYDQSFEQTSSSVRFSAFTENRTFDFQTLTVHITNLDQKYLLMTCCFA